MLFEADTNSEVLFAKLFETKDEEFRIYKQIVSFENGLIKKGYQRQFSKMMDFQWEISL